MIELNFDDLLPIEMPVRHKGKQYILREADGEAAVLWRNANMAGSKMDVATKVVTLGGNTADVQPLLVSLCLYEADGSGKLRLNKEGDPDKRFLVSLKVVKSWPERVVKSLFEHAKEISDLNEVQTKESIDEKILKLQGQREAMDAPNGQPASSTDG